MAMVCETSQSWSRFSDSQLVEQIRFTIEDIARTFGTGSKIGRSAADTHERRRAVANYFAELCRPYRIDCAKICRRALAAKCRNYPISALADRPPPDSQPSASSDKGAPVMPCSTLATPAMAAIAKTIALLKRPPKSDSQKWSMTLRDAPYTEPYTARRRGLNVSECLSEELLGCWCRWKESNPRPSHYECAALPTELHRHEA